MNYQCAVTQDLDRWQGEVDADAALEAWEELQWPDLKRELAEKLALSQAVTVTDHRGQRVLIDWSDITASVECNKPFDLAMQACLTDEAEAGRLMAEAVRGEIERQLEMHKADLLDELRRSWEVAA